METMAEKDTLNALEEESVKEGFKSMINYKDK